MEHSQTPSAYIACLASYNNGILYGAWIPLDGTQKISNAIQKMLDSSPSENAKEWAVHDSEYCGELNEYTPIKPLLAIQEAYLRTVAESIEWSLFWQYCECFGELISPESVDKFQDSYAGSDESLEIWCERFLEESGLLAQIPDNLRLYFDFKAYASDLEVYDVACLEFKDEIHVFWNH